MNHIIFASKNKNKIIEVSEILGEKEFKIVSLLGLDIPDIIEDGSTFEENAKIKAQTVYDNFRVPVIADDSGILVEQLDGGPGVYSARYSGESATDKENNEKLLFELKNFPDPHKARYVCAAVFYDGNKFISAFGEVQGEIIRDGKGTRGFGYDPFFVPVGYQKTMAELTLEEKNKISHRSIAFNELKKIIIKKRQE